MTLPSHTGQQVQSSFKRIQVFTILIASITLCAALLTAASGLQLAKLQKQHEQRSEAKVSVAPPAVQPAPVVAALNQKVQALESRLEDEKATTNALRGKIRELESKIAAAKASAPAGLLKEGSHQPEPVKKSQPPAPSSVPGPG